MKKGVRIGKVRGVLYKSAKLLGDVNAVHRGNIGSRVTNRVVGKVSGRVPSKINRGIMGLFK